MEKMRGRQEVGNRVTADIDHVFSFAPSSKNDKLEVNFGGKNGEATSKKEPD